MMDFDVNVSKVQGVLYSLGNQGLLNKLESLPKVVEAIKEVTCNLSGPEKSKIAFFMVLNTRLAVSEQLMNDDLVCLFTNTSFTIEKDYLITYMYHLNLQPQLFEVIENCPGGLSLELLDVIIKKLNEADFHKDEFGIEHLYQLWKSVFVKICKINAGIHLNDSCSPFIACFKEIYSLIEKVLITTMKLSGLEVFVGFHLYNFFKSILCFLQYKNLNLEDDLTYQTSVQFKNEESDTAIDFIKGCNSFIFENIFNILQNLTVDMWIAFSECHFDFDMKNSVQLLIGGLISSVVDEVKHSEVPSDVLNCLFSLAIKKSDFMASASVDEIISNVRNGEVEWFTALVSHQDFYNNHVFMCLLDHLHLASPDDLDAILKKSYNYLCTSEENNDLDLVKKLFLKAMKTTPDPQYWLEKDFEKYHPNLLTTADTRDEIIETFNKISKENNVPDRDMILLCMQLPFDTIKKICQMAVCGSHQNDFIIEIVKLLKHPCNTPSDDGYTILDHVLLKDVLKELGETEKQPFINFVVQLGKENLLSGSFFNNLLKTLKGCLECEILKEAVICLEIVTPLLNLQLFQVEDAPFLVFMSQVLGFFCWDLRCYSSIKEEGKHLAGCIVSLIISRLNETNGPEFQWARKEILHSQEVIQAHFCDLWFSCGRTWLGSGKVHSCILALIHSSKKADDLRKFLINFDEPFQVAASIVTALSVVLPISTFSEWNLIFNNLMIVSDNLSLRKSDVDVYCDVLDMFGSALFVLASISKMDRKAFLCYQHCLRKFSRMVGVYCPKMNRVSFFQTFNKILFIIKTVEDESERKCCWEVCSPALMELMDWMKKKKFIETDKNVIKGMFPLLNLEEVGEILSKNLQ